MKLKNIVSGVNFKIKKRSPELFMAAGIVGVVISTVMACRASKKVDDIIDEYRCRKEEIDAEAEQEEQNGNEYNKGKELTKNIVNTSMALVKLYGPSVVLGIFSVGCIFQSNRILRKRNIALAAAYNTLDKSFKKYKEKVIAKLGEEAERKLRLGFEEKVVEVVEVDENGKEKKKKEKVEVVDVTDSLFNDLSPYARVFDDGSTKWDSDPDYNRFFLTQMQNYANDYLIQNGYLFLNQVYEWLGLTKTLAGQQVGWIYDPKSGKGDNYVDFGIRTIYKKATAGMRAERNWVNGYEPAVWLDFNVDGAILHEAFDVDV